MQAQKRQVDGLKFWVRPGTSDEMVLRENVEKKDGEKWGVQFQPNDRWVDMGAYIGTFAIRAMSAGVQVVAFEPCPSALKLLQRNLKANAMDCPVVEAAVLQSPPASEVPLYLNEARGNFASNSTFQKWRREKPTVDVPCISFDEALEKAREAWECEPTDPVCLKLDIEGAEMDIIENLHSGHYIDLLTFEWHFEADRSIPRLRKAVERLEYLDFIVKLDRGKLPDAKEWEWWPAVVRGFAWHE